jgi:ureidoglycolate dehydrogenase (NAD+)
LAIDKGIEMPEGWAIDVEGQPTRDPTQVGALLPAGSYKGSGLAMMFECLSSLIVGNPLVARRLAGQPIRGGTQNSFVGAIDIAMFTDLEAYQRDADELVARVKELPTADGFDEVLVPGEPEDRTYDDRVQNGIPIPDGTARNLVEVAEKLDIPVPEWLQA